jgi:hypothetical protein
VPAIALKTQKVDRNVAMKRQDIALRVSVYGKASTEKCQRLSTADFWNRTQSSILGKTRVQCQWSFRGGTPFSLLESCLDAWERSTHSCFVEECMGTEGLTYVSSQFKYIIIMYLKFQHDKHETGCAYK